MKKNRIRRMAAAALAVVMMVGMTGCMKEEMTLDMREDGNYMYHTLLEIQYSQDLDSQLNEKQIDKIREYYNPKYVTVERKKDENGNPLLSIDVTKKFEKIMTKPSALEKRIGGSKTEDDEFLTDIMADLDDTGRKFIYDDKRFVLKFGDTSLADGMMGETETEVDPVVTSHMEGGDILALIMMDACYQSMKEMLKYTVTAQFPKEVKKTNGVLADDKKTVTWDIYDLAKIYARF